MTILIMQAGLSMGVIARGTTLHMWSVYVSLMTWRGRELNILW